MIFPEDGARFIISQMCLVQMDSPSCDSNDDYGVLRGSQKLTATNAKANGHCVHIDAKP